MVIVYANTLDVIGRRLYTGKSTWMREYLQNSIDAGANEIEIVFRDSELCINDNGVGMDLNDIEKKAFSIGNPEINGNKIGELGIGIYAGLGISNKIRILTKKIGNGEAIEAIFDVKKYYEIIEDRSKTNYSLDEVMKDVFSIKEVSGQGSNQDHYTRIIFEDLQKERGNIPTINEIREFVRNNINVPISSSFAWKKEIDTFVHGLAKEVKVSIIEGTGDVEHVTRNDNMSIDLYPPYTHTIKIPNNSGEEFARAWFCYSKNGESFDESKVVVRFKGMVIGDESTLEFRTGARIEKRLLGEIVINKDCGLEVNSERNWFVSSGALSKFHKELKELLQKVHSGFSDTDSKYGIVIPNIVERIQKLEDKKVKNEREGNGGMVKNLETQILSLKMELEDKRQKRDKKITQLKEEIKKNPQNELATKTLSILEDRKKADPNNVVPPDINNFTKKQKNSNFPKTVQTFLKEKIIDKELREKIEMGGVRQVASSSFIFIELMLKKKAGWDEGKPVSDFSALVNDFKSKNIPAGLNGEDLGNFMKNFDGIVYAAHYFFRNPSSHGFMEEMDEPRHIFQAMLIADYIVYMIRKFNSKGS